MKIQFDKICWGVIITLMCWISILKPFSILSNLALLIFFSYHIIKQRKSIGFNVLSISLIILFYSGYSLVLQQPISGVYRFSLILLFLCLAPFISFNILPINKIIFYCSFPFVIFIIGFEFWMLFETDSISAGIIRNTIMQNGMGDVYTLGGLYRIQLSGTGCLLVLYMFSFVTNLFPVKHTALYRLLYLLAILFAGNFAFIFGLIIFHILYLTTITFKRRTFIISFIAFLTISSLLLPYAIDYLISTIEEKSSLSNAERIFQASALIKDLSVSPLYLIFGKGLGNIVEIQGGFRDYSMQGDYYELQSLYFLNQMGVLLFSIYLIYNIWITIYFIPCNRGRVVYISYILYGLFNPYILNTLHVIVLLILCNLPRQREFDKLSQLSYA